MTVEPKIRQSGSLEDLRASVAAALQRFMDETGVDLASDEMTSGLVADAEMAIARERHAAERSALIESRNVLIVAQWRNGDAPRAIAKALDLGMSTVQKVIANNSTEAERMERQRRLTGGPQGRRFTEQEAFDAIRAAVVEIGRTPGVGAYDTFARRRGWPRGQSVADHFGGWSVAVEKAGFRPHKRPTGMGLPKYSDDAYCAALRRVAEVVGHRPSVGQYVALRADKEPTSHSFRKKYGNWLAALEHCCPEEALGDT